MSAGRRGPDGRLAAGGADGIAEVEGRAVVAEVDEVAEIAELAGSDDPTARAARSHPGLWMGGLLLLGLAILVAGMAAGSEGWAWADLKLLLEGVSGEGGADELTRRLVTEVRLPRTLGAWLAGLLLGLAGLLAQAVLRNPLADPYLLGSATGAALAVTLALVAGVVSLGVGFGAGMGLIGAAFVGALLAVLLTLVLARGAAHGLRLVLAGVVVGVVLGALTQLILLWWPQVMPAQQAFALGTTAFVAWSGVVQMAVVGALVLVISLLAAPALDGMALGEATARSLGVPVVGLRRGFVALMALATAAAVAHAGLVAFVGLAAPHLARSVGRTSHAWVIPLAALMGADLLGLADLLARVLIAPREIPVGVVTAVVGGTYLLWRLQRRVAG